MAKAVQVLINADWPEDLQLSLKLRMAPQLVSDETRKSGRIKCRGGLNGKMVGGQPWNPINHRLIRWEGIQSCGLEPSETMTQKGLL
jgi:hypothetical protein